MGATLADGGVNPVTNEQVVDAETCRYALAVMTTAGLYETSGDWLYDIGLPGKSGIGGGIVTVAPGQGRARHVLSAARRCRKQRQGSARCEVPVPATGNGPLRVETRGVIGARTVLALVAARRGRARLSGDRERRSRRTRRRSPRSTPRSCGSSSRPSPAATARSTGRSTSISCSTSRPWRLRGPWNVTDLVKIGPLATDLGNRFEYHLDFPGSTLDPGCDYERWTRRLIEGQRSRGLRTRRDGARTSGGARAPVLALLHLQRVQQPARRRLGDDPAQLRRGRCGRRALRRSRSRWATARTRAQSGRTGARTSSSSSTAPTPSSTRAPALMRTSTRRRSTSAARRRRASAATTRAVPISSSART